ncbi:MAG: phospholipase, partial [Mycobacteriaceae bacterium]
TNLPVEIFDRTANEPRRWPTFGIRIMPDLPEGSGELIPVPSWLTPRPLKLLEQVIATAIVGHDQTYVDRPCVQRRTIAVDTSPVGVVEFNASSAQRDQVTANGRRAASEFLATWDWKAFQADCRPG